MRLIDDNGLERFGQQITQIYANEQQTTEALNAVEDDINNHVHDNGMSINEVGDLNALDTNEKSNLVGAINEVYTLALQNNKQLIVNAFGEPLTADDSFYDMSNDIKSLLSTFKTNMMNAGVAIENGDKFKNLIDKIKGLTEGEGNKGIQFAQGSGTISSLPYKSSGYQTYVIDTNLDFTPTVLFWTVESLDYKGEYGTKTDWKLYETANSLINVSSSTRLECTLSDLAYKCNFYLSNVNSENFTLNYNISLVSYSGAWTENIVYQWYAIGVGEDTALRDSLADILENKGVDVTEEDDMASLITKVDGLSSNLDWMNNQLTMTMCAPYSTTEDTSLSGSSVEIYNDIAYVMSGNIMYTYNFKENTWSKLSKTKPTTAYYSSSAIIDGKIYYINGSKSMSPYQLANAHIEYYDIANNTWTQSTAKPSSKFYSAATAVYDKKIYMIGGTDENVNLSSVYCYDPVNDTCVKLKDAPIAINAARAVTVGEYIYMMGGGGYGSNVYASYAHNYCYDPKNDSWTKKTDIPMGTANPVVVAKDDKIYCMFGGSRSYYSNTYLRNKICCYNVADDSWTDTTTYMTAHNCSYGQYGDYILLVGGYGTPYPSDFTDSSSSDYTSYYIPRLIKIN